MTEPAYILGPNPAVMKRCRDKRAITPRISQSNQVPETTDSTTGDERYSRHRRSHARDHGHVRTDVASPTRARSSTITALTPASAARAARSPGLIGRDVQPRRDRNTVTQVEAEGDRRADSAKRIGRERVLPSAVHIADRTSNDSSVSRPTMTRVAPRASA